MPYRRLPNTDQARLRALRTAIHKAEKQSFDNQIIAFKTVHEAKSFLSIFEKQLIQYQQTLDTQVSANKKYQQIVHNVRLYISHFIQVFNLSVIRGDIKKEHKLFYQLDPNVHTVPDLSTEAALLHWENVLLTAKMNVFEMVVCQFIILPFAKVKVHYEVFKELNQHTKTLSGHHKPQLGGVGKFACKEEMK
jgi:hypothetical protein